MQGSRSHGGGNSGSAQSANSWRCRENLPATAELFCYCGIPAPVKISRTPKNNGRRFCSCENFKVCTKNFAIVKIICGGTVVSFF